MNAYSTVLLAELHLDPVSASLTASRRAAERSAQLQALHHRERPPTPARTPVGRRLLALVRS